MARWFTRQGRALIGYCPDLNPIRFQTIDPFATAPSNPGEAMSIPVVRIEAEYIQALYALYEKQGGESPRGKAGTAAWLPLRRGWKGICVGRNWFRRNSDPSQQPPLPRLLLPCVSSHKLGVRNVVASIFMASRIVCT
jgi:hypothetical protein